MIKKLIGPGPKPEPKPEQIICSKLLIDKDIGDYEYIESGYGEYKETQAPLFSDEGEQIGIVKCCSAGYRDQGKAGMVIVCPYDNRQYVENLVKQLPVVNKNFVLVEYKGQKLTLELIDKVIDDLEHRKEELSRIMKAPPKG